jgi:hypothetical protein
VRYGQPPGSSPGGSSTRFGRWCIRGLNAPFHVPFHETSLKRPATDLARLIERVLFDDSERLGRDKDIMQL